MNEEQFNNAIATLSEQLLNLTAHVTRLQSQLRALELFVATQASMDNPMLVLEALRKQAANFLNLDPVEQDRKRVAELAESLRLWKSGGSHKA